VDPILQHLDDQHPFLIRIYRVCTHEDYYIINKVTYGTILEGKEKNGVCERDDNVIRTINVNKHFTFTFTFAFLFYLPRL
jgi:hypothetical protein